MNDLIRPALYQAYHAIVPVRQPAEGAPLAAVDVVGPICESGDFLARDLLLPPLAEGDVVAIRGAGAVYNFAGIADLDEARTQPEQTVLSNVLGNVRVLEACLEHGVSRYLYASTVYVFSQAGGFYRGSKQASETYIEEYHRRHGLQYTILRYGSLYGPRSDHRNGLYRIVQRALRDRVLAYDGKPDTVREYIHVQDAARASVAVLDETFRNQHIVLTGPESLRIYDLLKMLGEILGIDSEAEFRDLDIEGHYTRTPYSYNPRIGRRYHPPYHVDFGQGLLQLIEEIDHAGTPVGR